MPDDIQSSLAPWMQSNLTDPSTYGGLGQLGLNILAQGPTPYRVPFGTQIARGALGAQQQAMQNAQARMQLAQQAMAAQQAQQMWPLIMQGMQGLAGGNQPSQNAGSQPPQNPGQPPSQNSMPSGGGMPPDMGMANLGAMLSLAGRPGGQQLLDLAKFQAENDPAHATQMATAKNEIAQDQATLSNALGVRNIPLAQAAYTKLLKDAGMLNVSAMSGDVTTFGGITPQSLGMSNFNPARGTQTVGGIQTPIPGAPQTQGTLAAAESVGKAAGETVELSDLSGNKYMVPKTAIVGGSGVTNRTPSAGGSSSPFAPNTASIGPGQQAILKHNADQAAQQNESYQQQMEAGQQMLVNTAELRHAASDFGSGRFAEARSNFLDLLNSANLITPEEKKQLGSAQVGQKIAIQLQAAATKQLGSREAAQIFSIMGKSLPNLTLSGDGLEKVSAYLDGVARYNMARGQMAQQRMNQNDIAGVNNVRSDFVQNTNPLYFIIASAAKAQQKEMIDSMGDQKGAFLKAWNEAANKGWAPRPGQYNGGS